VYTYTPHTNTSHGRGVYLHGGAGIKGMQGFMYSPTHAQLLCIVLVGHGYESKRVPLTRT
jgi:hypothetical protein